MRSQAHLESEYQKHLADLNQLSDLVQSNCDMWDEDLNTCDADALKQRMEQNKVPTPQKKESCDHCSIIYIHILSTLVLWLFLQDTENRLLKESRLKLEDVTFDIQCFISEHAQFLSPTQSSSLLKSLSSAQRAFREQAERLDTKQKDEQEKVRPPVEMLQNFADETSVLTRLPMGRRMDGCSLCR